MTPDPPSTILERSITNTRTLTGGKRITMRMHREVTRHQPRRRRTTETRTIRTARTFTCPDCGRGTYTIGEVRHGHTCDCGVDL